MRTIGTTMRNTVGALALLSLIPVSGWAAGPGMGGGFQGPPKEAFDACSGRKAGDSVRFTTPRGDNVAAVCREFDGKLAAAPVMGPGRGSSWDGPDPAWDGAGPGWGGRGQGRWARGSRGGGRGMGMGMGMGFGQDNCYMSEALNLTADQKTKIQGILDAEREKSLALHKQLWDSREQLQKVAAKTPYDEAAVRKLASAQEKAHADLIVSKTRAMNSVYALLTPEQKEAAGKIGIFGNGPGPGRGYGMGRGYGAGWGYGPGGPDCPWWR